MKVTDLKTYVVENPPPSHGGPYWVFLKLTTDNGIEGFGEVYGEILKEPIQWEDGYIIPPTKPGLGIELDEEVAAQHPYTGTVFPHMAEEPM